MGDTEKQFTDDDTLMRLTASGDSAAFGILVERHRARVLRVACRLLGGDADAADVVQEALLKAWRASGQYTPNGQFRSWLLAIVCNQCRDRWRKQPISRLDDQLHLAASGPGPEEVARGRLLAEAVRMAVMALPEAQREVFILSQYEGFRYSEIATMVGCPEGTVASRKYLAMEALRRQLKDWHEVSGP
jgi:RNA polymerase sigma-70 factor (ECF subfamily)